MEFLTIHTTTAGDKLEDLLSTARACERSELDGRHSATVRSAEIDKAIFFDILQDVALDSNAVIRNSPKLRKLVQAAMPMSVVSRQERMFESYLRENASIDIEGYVKFRMCEFNNHVNFLLYKIIKKANIIFSQEF